MSARRRLYELTVHGVSSEQPDRDPAVRELAEEIAVRLLKSSWFSTQDEREAAEKLLRGEWEGRLRTFLIEQDAEQAGALAALRGALEEAIARCPGCGGEGVQWGPDPGDSVGPNQGLDYSCQVCSALRAALAPGAGKAEAEVLRAVIRFKTARDQRDKVETLNEEKAAEAELVGAERQLFAAVDALLAARGGEG